MWIFRRCLEEGGKGIGQCHSPPCRQACLFGASSRCPGPCITSLPWRICVDFVCTLRDIGAPQLSSCVACATALTAFGNCVWQHRSGVIAYTVKQELGPVSVPLLQFRPSALAGPVRRTWVRVLTPEPSRVKSESADGSRMSLARPGCLSRAPTPRRKPRVPEWPGSRFCFGRV